MNMTTLALLGGEPVRKKKFPAYRTVGQAEKDVVSKVIDSGVLSSYLGSWGQDFYGGPEVRRLEEEWAAHFGAKHAIAVNSATSGLICAIGALGISPGDEVIVSPFTMSASATAPLWYGGVPIFADIESEFFCLDPKSVEQRITKRTKAIVVVDIFGQPYDALSLNAVARAHGIPIIEDCAQAPGAMYKGKHAGTLGKIGVYSLNYHKHIHSGEGGIVVTNDKLLAERVRLIRNHAEAVVEAKGETDLVNMVGQNFRLTEIQAAIARLGLHRLQDLNEARIRNCEYLERKLSVFPGLRAGATRSSATHVYYMQPFLYDAETVAVPRDIFIEAVKAELPSTELREGGALLRVGYAKPLYLLPLFQKRIAFGRSGWPFTLARAGVSYEKGLCPVAERVHEHELFLNECMRPPMSEEDLNDVVRAFEKVYEQRHVLTPATARRKKSRSI